MMKFKKFLAAAMTGAMMLGLVATTAPATNVYAGIKDKLETSEVTTFSAPQVLSNTATVSGPAIDYKYMTATFKTSDPFVILEVYKDPKKTDKVSATYTYVNNSSSEVGLTVDLGFYKATKDFGIRMYGSNATDEQKGGVETVKKQAEKLSIKIDVRKEDLIEAITAAGKSKEGKGALTLTGDKLGDYSYRSLYAEEWKTLDKFDYPTAKVAGTTIVVRKNAVLGSNGAPASPEAKVKIAASPKAPKVTIDYVKGIIKVTDKMKGFSLDADDATPVKLAKNMTIEKFADELGETTNQEFTAVIRTDDGKKAASMPCIIKVKAKPSLVPGATNAVATTSGSSITVSKVKDGELKLEVQGNAKFQYEKTPGSNKWVAVTSGSSIKMNGDKVKVRIAPVKEDTKNKVEGSFASDAVEIMAPPLPSNSEGGTN